VPLPLISLFRIEIELALKQRVDDAFTCYQAALQELKKAETCAPHPDGKLIHSQAWDQVRRARGVYFESLQAFSRLVVQRDLDHLPPEIAQQFAGRLQEAANLSKINCNSGDAPAGPPAGPDR
jgi:hypothetical protein